MVRFGDEDYLANMVGALFARHARAVPGTKRPGPPERDCPHSEEEAVELTLRISDQAAAAGLSRAHHSRTFHEKVGLSPLDYRRQMRVLTARSLIEAGTTLADAAAAAGFSDQPHMSRQFRRVLGVTPTAYFRSQHSRSRPAARSGIGPLGPAS